MATSVVDTASVSQPDRREPTTTLPPLPPIRRGRKDRRREGRRTAGGRYVNVAADARLNANGLADSPSPNIEAKPAVVPDPMEPGAHVIVAVNRRTDLLEREYARGYITEGAYRTGREVQATFEAALRMGAQGWTQGDRVDASVAHELSILTKVERAQKITALMDRIVRAVGMVGARRLRDHLVGGLTFPQAAAARGQCGREAVTFAAKYFRSLLEDVAESFAAKGADRK